MQVVQRFSECSEGLDASSGRFFEGLCSRSLEGFSMLYGRFRILFKSVLGLSPAVSRLRFWVLGLGLRVYVKVCAGFLWIATGTGTIRAGSHEVHGI